VLLSFPLGQTRLLGQLIAGFATPTYLTPTSSCVALSTSARLYHCRPVRYAELAYLTAPCMNDTQMVVRPGSGGSEVAPTTTTPSVCADCSRLLNELRFGTTGKGTLCFSFSYSLITLFCFLFYFVCAFANLLLLVIPAVIEQQSRGLAEHITLTIH
jgi:hypothetical protein